MAVKNAPQQANSQQIPLARPKAKTKTKGACRTCKVRKVKCDLSRPCCRRCQSTGRICEGYGIWGGGDADTHYTARQQTWDIYRCLGLSSSLANSSPDEKHYFEWFRSRTTIKLPGVFGSGFWEVLAMQVSHSESAALHAILAVSCAHKRLPTLTPLGAYSDEDSPDMQEQFMLQHYSKAICDVHKYFSAKDRASVRVVLIVCMLFVILELMRGRTRSGVRHLEYGMKVIDSSESQQKTNPAGNISSSPRENIDKWLLCAFSRLNLQAVLFGQVCARPRAAWQASITPPLTYRFDSLPDVRDTLDDVLTQILELTEQGLHEDDAFEPDFHHSKLHERQKLLQSELQFWFSALQNYKDELHTRYGFLAPVAYQSMVARYTAAKIMADRCFGNEGSFDRNTEDFRSIIAESIKTYDFCFSKFFASTRYAHKADVAPFVVDGAWIWPLYYTAIKCRVRRLRLQALKLLGSTYSMEAVCDSATALAIAKEVVEMEEPGLCDSDAFSAFVFNEEPRADELLPPAIPASSRHFDVEVTLPNLPDEMTVLSCKRKINDCGYEVLRREYDSRSQRWINKTTQRGHFMD